MFLRKSRLNCLPKNCKYKYLISNILHNDFGDVASISKPPPAEAKVVICGGGIMGASVAYHLAKLGWAKETVIIEQNR